MTDDSTNIEDSANVVNSIMLWRIYDVLWLLLAAQHPGYAAQVAEAHEKGLFLSPNPSVAQEEDEDGDDGQ